METDSSYGQVFRLPKRGASARRSAVALTEGSPLTEIISPVPSDPAATGFLASVLRRAEGPILWVQDHLSRRENGSLHSPTLTAFGIHQPVLRVSAGNPRDVLWAMEEGATCAGLSAVIGEIHGSPAVLDFTATKRLAMRAKTSGVPVYLVRSGGARGLSAARERWRVRSLPSEPDAHDIQAPGNPRWDLDLFRAWGRPPARWVACYDPRARRQADRLRLVSRPGDGTMDPDHQPASDLARA